MFSTGQVLDILDKELQDSENDNADSCSHDSIKTMNVSVIMLMKNARNKYCSFFMMSL